MPWCFCITDTALADEQPVAAGARRVAEPVPLAARVQDWPWSSFHRNVQLDEYSFARGASDLWYGDEFNRLE
jgi:hypothetical protein